MSRDIEPCAGAYYHSPQPLWTERHHVHPKYLSALLGLPVDPILIPLCETEHGNVHHALTHLINTGTNPHRFAEATQDCVDDAWSWWQEKLLAQEDQL